MIDAVYEHPTKHVKKQLIKLDLLKLNEFLLINLEVLKV